jgi:hypothetical protein
MKMHRMTLLSGVGLLAAALQGLAEDKTNQAPAAILAQTNGIQASVGANKAPSKPELPIIGYIESRGRVITLKAGPNGTIYSCKTTDGKVLFENLSAEQLRAQSPDLDDFVKSAIATGKDPKGAVLDGRVMPFPDARLLR